MEAHGAEPDSVEAPTSDAHAPAGERVPEAEKRRLQPDAGLLLRYRW